MISAFALILWNVYLWVVLVSSLAGVQSQKGRFELFSSLKLKKREHVRNLP